jgi:hypothetical protein
MLWKRRMALTRRSDSSPEHSPVHSTAAKIFWSSGPDMMEVATASARKPSWTSATSSGRFGDLEPTLPVRL